MSGGNDRRDAVGSLYEKYGGVLYDLAFRLLGDRAEAEDAVQEAFVSAYRSFDSFTYGESRLPWLYRIATNACFKIMRTRRRKGALLVEDTDRNPARSAHPVDALHSRRVLERLVGELDERGYQILVGYYLTGMQQEEIAEVLGISRRAVVKRLTALRNRVGDLFEEA